MTKNIGLLLLVASLITSCKRQYAFVQPAKVDVFAQKQRSTQVTRKSEKVLTKIKVKEQITETEEVTFLEEIQIERTPLVGKSSIPQPEYKNKIISESLTINSAANQQIDQTQKRPVKKKRKKNFKRWNNMIPSGLIFLGIAILLSLINLNGLALLFGVASIIFLFFGIKKLLRKKRRREIFR